MLSCRCLRLLGCFIFAVVAGSVARAVETPAWTTLTEMYGQPLDSAPMRSMIARYKLRKIANGASGSLGATDHSYTLMYNGNQIDCIFFQVEPWPPGHGGWTTYTGELPFGLQASDDTERVAERLGPPSASGSGHFQYKGYRLVIMFRETGRGIQDIYIWKDAKAGT